MEFEVRTEAATDVVDVTGPVEEARADETRAGTCTVFVAHTTAGVVVNEAEPRLLADVENALEVIVPDDGDYRHDELDGNAAAHLRAMLAGESVTVPIVDGELALGTWQSILLVECDGPRQRTVQVVETSG